MKTRYLVSACVTLALMIPALASAEPPAQVPVQGYLTTADGDPVDGSQQITVSIYDQETGGTALYNETLSVEADNGAFTAHLGTTKTLDLSVFQNNQELYAEIQVGGETLQPRLRVETAPYAASAGVAEEAQNAQQLGGNPASSYQYSAGTGLTKNGSAFEVDTSSIQQRISNQCATGEAAFGVKQNGDLMCRSVASAVQTGKGLSKSGGTIRVAGGGIDSSLIANNSVGQADLSSGSVGSSELRSDAVLSAKIKDGEVKKDDLASGAVTSGKISSGAVTSGKLSSGAVTSGKINGGAVNQSKISSGAVSSNEIDSSVTSNSEISFSGGALNIPSSEINKIDIDSDEVGTDELRSNAVTSSEVDNDTLTYDDMRNPVGCDSNTNFKQITSCSAFRSGSGGLPGCDEVTPGGVCEANTGDCPNTSNNSNHCTGNGFEVYIRLNW